MTKSGVTGLEDVVAGTSSICFIDGKEGRLIYRGYNVDDLVQHGASFEEVIYLLYHDQLPSDDQLQAFKQDLFARSFLSTEMINILKQFVPRQSPMAALRSAVSLLQNETSGGQVGVEQEQQNGLTLVAQIPTLVAAIGRLSAEEDVLPPQEHLSLAANFLYMLQGQEPDALHEETMNVALILHADHEFNASTFAARVTAATKSDIYSAITSAVGTLKGPLHGGANEAVMRLLLEIGDVEQVERVIQDKLARKQKISGFGHRVYKTMDPRAVHLKKLSRRLAEQSGDTKWFDMTEEIEKVVFREKGLYPNVDLYSASTYHMMGIDLALFTPIFAVSRMAGWTAHVLEQYANNRLIRPASVYTGEFDRQYIPMDHRS